MNVKPANLKRAEPKKEYFVHPVTGQIMVPRTTSAPVTDTSIVSEGIANLHAAVLGWVPFTTKERAEWSYPAVMTMCWL